MRENIRRAQAFVEGADLEAFHADVRTVYAVTRCLEIVSEASRRLPDELKARHPGIPRRDVAGAGSVYRHGYETVTDEDLWDTVKRHLPRLLDVVEAELAALSSTSD